MHKNVLSHTNTCSTILKYQKKIASKIRRTHPPPPPPHPQKNTHNQKGLATICRFPKNTGLFCEIALYKIPIFCKSHLSTFLGSLQSVATPYLDTANLTSYYTSPADSLVHKSVLQKEPYKRDQIVQK